MIKYIETILYYMCTLIIKWFVNYSFNEFQIEIFNRNLQDGSIEVDGGVEVSKRSPGKLRQLNTDTGLYVGKLNSNEFIDLHVT